MNDMFNLAKLYMKSIEEEIKCKGQNENKLAIKNVGKIDPKRHLATTIDETSGSNIA